MGDASGSPHLPKRCPVCKGAGIQPVPNKTPGSVLWFYCAFCKHVWKVQIDDPKRA